MKIKTTSAAIYSLKDYEPDFLARYFGEISIQITTPYMVGPQLETQVIELNLIVLQDGSIDTNGVQTESRWVGEYTEHTYQDGHYYATELTTAQFDQWLSLDEVKREIALFGHQELAA
ncbi:hypothetical protein G9F31_01005 [Acinetobacter sp. 187]|uniref:hypothetical protein n=1 Tax=Acinetobacter lanii TaxID=2715163 RepID=UPI0014095C65|nr:hypothetical protein [Acinetobacter lanii]NHC02363.1 hypothetical protein [Acinetobacter lanii]